MRQINRNHLSGYCFLWATIFMLLVPLRAIAAVGAVDRDAWKGYTQEQKGVAIAGFLHCYRSASSQNHAFAQTDVASVIRIVDETGEAKGTALGSLILQALRKAPNAKPDVHAEHWSGPYGFSTGLLWRGLENPDREAYVQGVFWCAETAPATTVSLTEKSVGAAVKTLDDWYVVSDDDWKDPRSNARVDVPVAVAMQRAGILSIRPAKKP